MSDIDIDALFSDDVDDLDRGCDGVNECMSEDEVCDSVEKKRGFGDEKDGSTAQKKFAKNKPSIPSNSPENIDETGIAPKIAPLIAPENKKDTKKKRIGRPKGAKSKSKSIHRKVYDKELTTILSPQAGPQSDFLSTEADICIYGGARGGGKTHGVLMESMRNIEIPGFNAVILRETQPEITKPGGLWDSAYPIFSSINGAVPIKSRRRWEFPSGSKIEFAGLEKEDDKYKFLGMNICLICWEELTNFSETAFWFLMGSNRSVCGVKPYIRATCNPKCGSWVAELISWWIGAEGYPISSRSGVLRYFTRRDDILIWGDTKQELLEIDDEYINEKEKIEAEGGVLKASKLKDLKQEYLYGYKSLTFIASRVTDNKALMDANPEYIANLRSLGRVEKEQYLYGNWKIKNEAGKFFNRDWFKIEKHLPDLSDYKEGVKECRFFDFAATKPSKKNRNPDYSVGIKIRKYPDDNKFYVVDVVALRENPAEVEKMFLGTCMTDKALADKYGQQLLVRWEEEPGSAGKRESYRLVSMLGGYNCRGIRSTKNKEIRAKPFAIQAEARNVILQEADWNEQYLSILHMFTDNDSIHDDMVDGSSGSFNELTSGFIYPTLDEEDDIEDRDPFEEMVKRQEELENDFLECNDLDD